MGLSSVLMHYSIILFVLVFRSRTRIACARVTKELGYPSDIIIQLLRAFMIYHGEVALEMGQARVSTRLIVPSIPMSLSDPEHRLEKSSAAV